MDAEKPYRDSVGDTESLPEEALGEESDGLISGIRHIAGEKRLRRFSRLMPYLLVFSVGLNALLGAYFAFHEPPQFSLYANLPENELEIPFHYATDYSSEESDPEDKDALWNAIDVSEGFIAITHEESDSMGLPRSKTFPWDANKGMYVTHGYHALHCTVLLHAYTYDNHRGRQPLVSYHHVEHCLDLLRQDIICHADDFLDFTAGHGDEFLTGDNQPRKCRDWSKLSKWVKQRSSCYKTVNITRAGEDHGVEHQLDRYTYCPEGSPYHEVIAAWRDLNRPNHGNINAGANVWSDEDLKADAEALAKHNADILGSDPESEE